MTGQVPLSAPIAKAIIYGRYRVKPQTAQARKPRAATIWRLRSTWALSKVSPSFPPTRSPAAKTRESADMKKPARASS